MARGFNSSIVDECLKQDKTKKYLFKKLVQLLRQDIKKMCSGEVKSVFQNKSTEILGKFSWEMLVNELSANAPTLFEVLKGCTTTKKTRTNRAATIGMCAAIVLQFHYHRMSLVQRILSLILYAGHSAKLVGQYSGDTTHTSLLFHYRCMNVFKK